MSSREQQIQALKRIFKGAENSSRRKRGSLSDIDLHGELQHAISMVEEHSIYELKEEVYQYLTDVFWEYRESAIRALCGVNGLQLPELKNLTYKIWLEDSNEHVKVAALSAWAGYYIDTKDPIILKNLYNIFRSGNYPVRARVYALYGFMKVADAFNSPRERSDLLDLTDLEDNNQLTKAIDWGKVFRIMDQYVPGWKK